MPPNRVAPFVQKTNDGSITHNASRLGLDRAEAKREDDIRLALEERAAQAIAEGLRLQLEAITGEDIGRSPATPDEVEQRLSESNDGARSVLERILAESTVLGVQLAIRQLMKAGVYFNFRMVRTLASQWAAAHSNELMHQLDQTSLASSRKIVSDWRDSGDDVLALSAALALTFGIARARLIAQTESTRAYAEGALRGYHAAGYAQYRPTVEIPQHPGCRCFYELEQLADGSAYFIFRTAGDSDVCNICRPHSNTRVGLARNPD